MEEENHNIKIQAKGIEVFYDTTRVLNNINMDIGANTVTALIGPSGCGKSTFLRLINRMNDYIESFHMKGEILLDGKDIYSRDTQVELLRKKVGMVFQKPNPFPKSIFENVVYGLRIQGMKNKSMLDEAAEKALRQSALWDEVKDNLKKSALALSGGQQQRLCMARTLAVEPSVILMDEPASALDPISTAKIEELIVELKKNYTIIIVTHNMHQAGRVSDKTGFFYMGNLIEFGDTKQLFLSPKKRETENYISGRFG